MPTIFQIALQEALDSLETMERASQGKQTVSYGTGKGVVNDKKIRDAIENHWCAIIRYRSKKDKNGVHTKKRYILPVAYGKTKAGNDVVRAFQQQGDTNTFSPHWKFFRVDRILGWQQFKHTNFDTSNLELYNPNGDKSMASVYVQAKPGKKRKNGKGSVEVSKRNADDNVTVSPVNPVGKNEPKINAGPLTKGDIKNQEQTPSLNVSQPSKNIYNTQQNQYSNDKEDSVEAMYNDNSQPITKSQITNDNPTPQNQTSEPVDNSQMQDVSDTYLSKSDISNDNDTVQQLRAWNQRIGNLPKDNNEEDEDNNEVEY